MRVRVVLETWGGLNSKENSTTRVLKQTSIQSPKGKTMNMNQAQTWSSTKKIARYFAAIAAQSNWRDAIARFCAMRAIAAIAR